MHRSRIIHGDSLKAMAKLPAASVQLVVADPPYFQVLNQEWDQQWARARAYLDWSLAWLEQAMRVLR